MISLTENAGKVSDLNRIPSIDTVYMDLAPYGETMAAMNYINHKKIIPISQSYIPGNKISAEDININHPLLTNQIDCTKIANADWRVVVPDKLFLINKISTSESDGDHQTKIDFNSTLIKNCNFTKQQIMLIDGFGLPESWGTWTVKKEAIIRFFWNNLDYKNFVAKFNIIPFVVPGKINSQTIYLKASGLNQTWSFDSNEVRTLEINLPKEVFNSKDKFIDIQFYFPNATRPKDIDGSTTDERQLAIGLISIEIMVNNTD